MIDRERFSPAQCRAARALLTWQPVDLALRARLEPESVELYEAAAGELGERDLAALGRAFVQAGVIAIPAASGGEGVRFTRPRRTAFASDGEAFGSADVSSFPVNLRDLHGG